MDKSSNTSTIETRHADLGARDQIPMILWAINTEGILTVSDGNGLKLLGVKAGELVGKAIVDLYPEFETSIEKCLGGKAIRSTVTIKGVVLDTGFAPVRGKGGKVTGAFGSSIVITHE